MMTNERDVGVGVGVGFGDEGRELTQRVMTMVGESEWWVFACRVAQLH